MSAPSIVGRLAVHTITTKPWSLAQAAAQYSARGIGGISVWIESMEGITAGDARGILDDHGLKVPALVRGGFFCDPSSEQRRRAIDRNRGLIATAATLGAEMLVLVVGAHPGTPLDTQRGWVADAIRSLVADAEATGVKLAIEPLHPMYAADRSCINRIGQAREICDSIRHPSVGVAVDVYHVWWDPDLDQEIAALGRQNALFAYHLCDWRVPTRDLLNDRALMGDGCIDLAGITAKVRAAGFNGWEEVEIFSEDHWREDQGDFLDKIVDRYAALDHAVIPARGVAPGR